MPWYDSLKDLFKDAIHFSFKDCFNKNTHVHVTINSSSPIIQTDPQHPRVEINLGAMTEEQKEKFARAIKAAIEDDIPLIEQNSQKLIEAFTNEDAKPENKSLLEKLKPYLPDDDLKAFRAALFLRSSFQSGGNVDILRDGIIQKHGDRGRIITNLCTAGYFEDMILPLVDEIGKRDFTADAFRRVYGTIIRESAFAVFVHARMNEDEVAHKIREKIDTNKRYGLSYVCIHGIGKKVVKRITINVDKALKDYSWLEKKEERLIGAAVFVRLEFRQGKIEP